jgi:hypothetical protein
MRPVVRNRENHRRPIYLQERRCCDKDFRSFFEHGWDLHDYLIRRDLSAIDLHFNLGASDVVQCLSSASDSFFDSILKRIQLHRVVGLPSSRVGPV